MNGAYITAILSPAVLIALITLLLRICPPLCSWLSNRIVERIDPKSLKTDSWLHTHIRQLDEHGMALRRLERNQTEARRDTIKNTIIMLMSMQGDHRVEVRYELGKLEALHSDCWVVDAARKYILDGTNPLERSDNENS